uniref:Putative secreted protein n=1 Tax=Anopheles marajoara TaxID=58244 RepID=A0A2M4CD38_9DIPT
MLGMLGMLALILRALRPFAIKHTAVGRYLLHSTIRLLSYTKLAEWWIPVSPPHRIPCCQYRWVHWPPYRWPTPT